MYLKRLFYLFVFLIVPYLSGAQVTAGFTVDYSAGCVPLVVHFTNTSTGAVSYAWDLGNGSMPTIANPLGTYVAPGTYNVTLIAYDASSASSTYTTTITVYPLPIPGFFTLDTAVCKNLPATFTNTSIGGTGSLTYNWNFGDGLTSTDIDPIHSWDHSGFYNITLYATDAMGCVGTFTRNSYVHVLPLPTANFSGSPTYNCSPRSVNFIDSSSGTAPLTYAWSFGDGGTSTLSNPSHFYSVPNSWNSVELIVTDSRGCKDTFVRPGYIQLSGLTAGFTSDTSACITSALSFPNTSTTHYATVWNYGDGFASTGEDGYHSFMTAGTFNVSLAVYDGTCWDTLIRPVIIHALPAASYTVTPANPCPAPATLTYTATLPPGCTATWSLAGVHASGNPATRSSSAVIFFDTLYVTDAFGCVGIASGRDTVPKFATWKASGCAPLIVDFNPGILTAEATDLTTGAPPPFPLVGFPYPDTITSYLWNFGDGSPTSTLPSVSHTYPVGLYTASVTVTTSNGCTKTVTYPIKSLVPPVVHITSAPSHICFGRTVSLSGTASPATDFGWDFGDFVAEAGPGPKAHDYTVPGSFLVKFVAANENCSMLDSVTVIVDSPQAAMNISSFCSAPNSVTFNNISIGTNSYVWLFGDGATSTVSPITHSYATPTTYTAKLATFNIASGCRDTATTTILLTPLTATLTATSTSLCYGSMDTITAAISGGTWSSYKWLVDGIAVDSISNPSGALHYGFPAGIHSISLVLKNARGCWDTFTRANYITVSRPICSFTVSPATGCTNSPFTFTDATTNVVPIPVISRDWNFYDATGIITVTTPSISHPFTGVSGIRPVRETVTDAIGCTSTYIAAISVNQPVMDFNVSSATACIGRPINFTNFSVGVVNCYWMFGDGTTSTALHPTHAYSASGTYTVRLGITDINGCHDTLTRINFITIHPSPHAAFTMSDTFAVCAPLNVTFTNTSTGATSYYWTFGNGAVSYATNPSNPYTIPGSYAVALVAYNALGCSDTARGHASIFGYAGAFTYSPIAGCSPLPVHFSVSVGGTANITWDFADGFGTTSTSDTITHTYSTPGAYLPKLVLTDPSGCTAFSYGADTIKVNNLTPWFSQSASTVCVNTPITFTDSSYSTLPSSNTRSWTFGDGGTSTLGAPVYTYTTAGTYTVTLVVTNASGCTRTVTRTITVNPLPTFSGSLAACVGMASTLSGTPFGGVWSGGAAGIATISSGGVLTGIANGTARITYTSTSGCITTAIATVYPVPAAISGDSIMCQSAFITLASSPSGGTWSSSAVGVAVTGAISGSPICAVTGMLGGTAIITYTVGSGCFATKQITVNASVGAISGPPAVCIATTATYTTSASGGTWVSGNTSVATINPSSGLLSAVTAGTSIITYTVATGCSATRTVTVVPLPAPITGPPNVCQGASATLVSATPGGTWSSNAPTTGSIGSTTGVLTGVATGVVTITYTVGTGCYNTRQFTINAAVGAISGPTSVCNKASATLTTLSSGGIWLSGDTSIAHIDTFSGVVAPGSPGTVTITYKVPTGCSAMYNMTVLPLPLPITGDSAVCQGLSGSLASATAGGTWSSSAPGIAFAGMTTGLLTGIAAGTATITYKLGTGCYITKQVTTNAAVSAIVGPSSLCNGTPGNYTTPSSGGVWLSGDTMVAYIDSFSGLMLPISAGTVTITYQVATGCAAMLTVTVLPTPGAITGILSICHHETTTLSDTTTTGNWVSLSPAIATINSAGVVTSHLPGMAIIAYVLPNSCYVSAVVTVNPLPPTITGPSNICVGSTLTLANSAPGGTWMSSSVVNVIIGYTSGAMTGMSAGTGIITYTLPTGCMTTKTVTVLAVPPPISGPNTVCGGHAINLTNALPGGVWNSPGAPGIATFNPVTAVVIGITPGTIMISYTIFNGCAATSVITVNPLPPPIGGTARVCVYDTTTLTNFVTPGTWTSSNITIATIDPATGVTTGVSLGTANITYTIATGCYNIREVTVNPVPAVLAGSSVICEGATTVFATTTSGGIWSSYDNTIATVAPLGTGLGTVLGVSAGTTTISYRLISTGCYVTKNVTVNLTPPGITGSGHVCHGSTRTLSNTMSGGVWTSSNPAIAPVSSTGVVSGLAMGTSVIDYMLPTSGCSASKVVTVQPLPYAYTVTGGGSYCSSGTGVHVGLNGSQIGVSYALYYGASATGYLTGTNLPLDFGLMTLAGVYTVQATNAITGCTRNMSGSAAVTITPPAVPVVSIHSAPGDTVCPGGMTTVSPIAVNGGSTPTYVWKVNGVPVSTAPAYSFIPADGDLVGVTMTSSSGCVMPLTANAEKVLHVAPLMMPMVSMTVEPGDTVCQYSLVTYMATPSYGGSAPTYRWMVNSTTAGTGPVFSYVPADGDMIECHMLSNYLCRLADSAISGSVMMEVDSMMPPHIVVTPHPGCAVTSGTTVTFTTIVTDAGPTPAYQWYINGVPVAGETNDSFVTSSLHHYDSVTCRVTSSGVCHDISAFDWAFISISPVGVQPLNTTADIRLVPNPNNGTFTIKGTWAGLNEEIYIEVTNMLGQSIYRGRTTAHNGKVNEQLQLDRALANGMYMLNMQTATQTKVFHFVVEQ